MNIFTNTDRKNFSAIRNVPLTGVIYVMAEAEAKGYNDEPESWVNFGQGQPESGHIPGSSPRIQSISMAKDATEYGPVAGVWAFRQTVADFYNQIYRKGKKSLYTAENVSISSGGRSSLTRIMASMDRINIGHFLPDYTAYEELLCTFQNVRSLPIILSSECGYDFEIDDLRREIIRGRLEAILLSNPCNPTGKLIFGENLENWVHTAQKLKCMMIFDEFYSSYIWTERNLSQKPHRVSAAEFVKDVNEDPILIIDGLTKNWRYPGWRLSWTVGPKDVIQAISSAGSFLDGGASHPMQIAAIELLEKKFVEKEAFAIQNTFRNKRDYLLKRLKEIGVEIELEPQGTFYIWGNLRNLPEPVNNGMGFFKKALDYKVITVPGEFFDINPGGHKPEQLSLFHHHARFSFGPEIKKIELGLTQLNTMLKEYS